MKTFARLSVFVFPVLCTFSTDLPALDRPDVTFQVYQFPRDKIPRIDGDAEDWAFVPDSYVVGTDQLVDTDGKNPKPNPSTLDVKVRVGWVEGLNRLYFLYEAYDDVWHFADPGLVNDTFEVVVDGDASGGPLIDFGHRDFWKPEVVGTQRALPDQRISSDEAHWATHGVHAQNYHIFTPAVEKEWTLAWGSPTWTKNFPHANAATTHDLKPGGPGKLVLEFWITPYDYAGPEGPQRAVESVLEEGKILGLGWIIIDYDEVGSNRKNGFWVLSRDRRMFGDASALPAFRLMPLEARWKAALKANWSSKVVDMQRRLVAFRDESDGQVTSWWWDFGDGATSTERHPLHTYSKPGNYVVVLEVSGPAGKTRHSKVWDVQLQR